MNLFVEITKIKIAHDDNKWRWMKVLFAKQKKKK